MIAEDQSHLETFQKAQATYSDFLHRRGEGEELSFEELLSRHRTLAPMLRGLHDAFCQGRSSGVEVTSGSPARAGATTVVDCRRGEGRRVSSGSGRDPYPLYSPSQVKPDHRYVPQGELARGGMGAILKVWDRDLGRTLAMKVLLDESLPGHSQAGHLDRFLQEAQVMARLDHPGIVPVHDVGFDLDGRPYFTMRFIDGLDLEEVVDLAREGVNGWNPSRAVGVIVKTCQTMAYAHRKGVIHRDLKPANVMIGHFGEVYVIDWGLAKVLDSKREGTGDVPIFETQGGVGECRAEDRISSRSSSVRSGHGIVVGTPPFMPPEQAEGAGNTLGLRSDIYSLGAILYTLLTGHAPYAPRDGTRLSPPQMTDRVLEGPPTPIRELDAQAPDELVAICEKAMAREPSDRYRSAMDMAEDLQRYLDARVIHAQGATARLKEWVKGHRGVAGFAGVAVFLMTLLPALSLLPGWAAETPADEASTPVQQQATAPEPDADPRPECSVAKSCSEGKDVQSS